MAINLSLEKQCKLSTQELCDIMNMSAQLSNEDGFVNSFVFNRAIYIFAAMTLFEDSREELQDALHESFAICWDKMLNENLIDSLIKEYSTEINLLADYGSDWFDEYKEFIMANSNRMLDVFSDKINNITNDLTDSFKGENGADIDKILQLAKEWGFYDSEVAKQSE